jgi:hypothetical protein
VNLSVTYAPVLPISIIMALALIGLALVGAAIFARQRGAGLRLFALAALVAGLFNPNINSEVREPLTDIAVLLVDKSASQSIQNRTSQTARALAKLKASLAGLKNLEVRTAFVTSGLSTRDDGTQAFAALKTALADIPPERYAGTILLSDGQIHDVPKPTEKSDYNAPLHVLLSGSKSEKDRRISIIKAPRFAIVGEQQTIAFKVEQWGNAPPGSRALVTLAIDGRFVTQMPVGIGQTIEQKIDIRHGGQNIIELSVNAFNNELSRQNNRAVTIIQGIRDRLRVLLVSGKPHPGERTWRNLLKADPAVDLVHFTILRPPDKQDGTPINELSLIAFPTRELFSKKLAEFDLVIFDRYSRRGVLPGIYFYNITDYVNNGGAVLVAAGPDYAGPRSIFHSPLSDILPASPSGEILVQPYRPLPTIKGSRHPVIRDLKGGDLTTPKWGKWFRLIDANGNNATTLLTGPQERPLLLVARKGKGRIAQLMSDHSWLWARGYDGGGPQAELLRRIAHWLMREPDLEEEKLYGRQQGQKLIVTRQTMGDEPAPVTITSPSGKITQTDLKKDKPGLWRARIKITEAGIYKLADNDKIAFAGVGSPDPRETGEIHSTGKKLAPLAKKSGGSIKRMQAGIPRLAMVKPGRATFGSGWIGLKANGVYDVKSVETIPLFTTLLALAGLLALICGMWYREGR